MRTPLRIASVLVVGLLASASAEAAAQNVTLAGCSNWSWDANTSTLTCSSGGTTTPNAPTGCTVNGSNPYTVTLPTGGGAVPNLTATCSGTPATTWTWTQSNSAVQPSANGATSTYQPPNVTSSTTIIATPFNGTVQGSAVTVSVNVTPASGGGGGGGGGTTGTISCSPLGTLSIPVTYPAAGATTSRILTTNYGGFGSDTVMVASFTTSSKTGIGRISLSEYGSGPVMRLASLSPTPCTLGPGGSTLSTISGVGVTLYFQVGGTATRYPLLQPNTTYYFNVRNYDLSSSQSSCPAGSSCDAGFDIKSP